jgi:alpha-galactosidase
MKHLVALCVLILLSTSLIFAADLSGIWLHSAKQADGHTTRMVLVLQQNEDTLTGKIEHAWGTLNITKGTVDGNRFSITAATSDGRSYICEGTLNGEILHITVRDPNAKPYDVIAVRSDSDPFRLGGSPVEPPPVRDLPSNGLAKTPPMGWNSWNLFAGRVDDKTVREMADAMVTSGMRDAGYVYLNIDDTWEGDRDANGVIHSNNKFPDMKALADYVHSKGLKFGIYSGPGPYTCAGYEGSYGHEAQDAHTYAAWGVDYLKYDWCSAGGIYPDSAMRAVYQKMADALRATNRPMVYSLCQYGKEKVWEWGALAGGNLWRTTDDINDTYKRMMQIVDTQSDIAKWAGPGHWNDPDMLEIGNGGMTTDEYRTHMSLWAMFAAPLLAGNDVRKMSPEIRSILMNKDVIAIDQDPLGEAGQLALKRDGIDYWKRPLSGGGTAIAAVNRSDAPISVKMPWKELGLETATSFKDVWHHTSIKQLADSVHTIPMHGVVLLRTEPTTTETKSK